MEVQTFYADLDRYRDRTLMLRAAAERVGHIRLFTVTPPRRDDLSSPHLTVEPLFERTVKRPRVMARLWRRLRRSRADLVHDTQSHMLAAFAELSRREARPFLLTSTFTASYAWVRNLRREYPYRAGFYVRQRVHTHVEEWAMGQLVDGMTVFGEGHREPVAESYGLDLSQVHSLPNCADGDLFSPRPADPATHGLGARARVLLFSGNIFRYKGAYVLLRAFARVRPRHPDARLMLVGALHPAEVTPVTALVRTLGLGEVVSLPGKMPRESLPAIVSSCHAYVMPSFMEGCPRGVIEAMACGRPVVATALPGIVALDPDRAFSELVPRADEDGLVDALDRTLSESATDNRRRGDAARARYLAHHTPEAAAVALAALYGRLAG